MSLKTLYLKLMRKKYFTDEEKKEWIDQTYLDIINSFPSKEDKKYGAPKDGDGGGSGKKTFKPITFFPNKKKEFNANGAGYSWSGDIKNAPILGALKVIRTEGKKQSEVEINNAVLKNLFMDNAGNVVILYDELAGTLSKKEIQDKQNAIDALIAQGNIAEAEKERETLETQSTKPKNINKLVILPEDEDKLGMVASATGMYGSTSEMLEDLRKKAGMKTNTGGSNKTKETPAQRAARIASGK